MPNQGQTDRKVRVLARGLGGMLFFADDEIVLAIAQPRKDRDPADGVPPDPKPHPRTVLRIRYEGANKTPQIEPIDELPTRTSYYIGNDPAQWQRNLVSYAGTVYRQLYPGIDLRFDGANGRLKSTYTVAPGADSAAIRWRYHGGADPRLDASGNLVIDLPKVSAEITATEGLTRTLTEHAPVAWQLIDGQRVDVPVRFVIEPNKRVGFAVGTYDIRQPLLIDPTFSTYLGGNASDKGNDIAVDLFGNSYVVGTTSSTQFPTFSALPGTGDRGGTDIFVAKFTASGTFYAATYLGGDADDEGNGIAIDNSFIFDGGVDILVVGSTYSSNFPPLNARHSGPLGGRDAVAVRIFDNNIAGQFQLVASTYLGGIGFDQANDVAAPPGAGSAVDAFIVGYTTSSDFTDHQNTLNFHDAFVLRLSANGSTVRYSRFVGGDDLEKGQGIAVDSSNNAYITGWTLSSTGFNPLNAAQPTYGGGYDAFIAKLGPTGMPLYSSYFGGTGQELGYGIALSGQSAYITGHTKSVILPGTAGKFQQACASGPLGCNDAFVTRYSSTGALQWSTYLGSNMFDYGQGIAVDATGTAYVTGITESGYFPTVFPIQAEIKSFRDAFVSAIDSTGTKLLYSTYLGGTNTDEGQGIAVDTNSSIYITGWTASSDFPAFREDYSLSDAGGDDAFVAKLSGTLGFEFTRPTADGAGDDATADKPQSKLWWNDGIWWAVLYSWERSRHSIWRLTWPNEWVWAGTDLDTRYDARTDALWDNGAKKLYIVSMAPSQPNEPLPSNAEARLYRYSYASATKIYSLDAGFPKVIMTGQTETMVIDKDSTGKLWVAYTNAYTVKYQVSADDGVTWSNPATLPHANASGLSYDDISTVVAFDGKIGVLWSRHNPNIPFPGDPDAAFYFMTHTDGTANTTWSTIETVAAGTCISDDHLNLKAPGDGSGKLFAAIKSSYEDDPECGNTNNARNNDTQLWLAVRAANGTWSRIEYGKVVDDHTRPALLLDPVNRQIHMFAASPEVGGGIIYRKTTNMDNPSFANQPGKGTPFISSPVYHFLNNPTTTKQPVNGTTNLLVLATDQDTDQSIWNHFYMHNVIDLPGQAPPSGATYTFGPVADTYVNQASATSNYATSSSFSVVGGTSSARQAFLRFTLSGLPAGAVVQNAKLRLYVTNDSTSGGSFNKITNTTWAETITWNSKPAIDGPLLATLGAVAVNTSYEVDVTAAITGNGTYSFAITLPTANTNTLGYASREATTTANRPQLIITTQ